MGGVPTILVAVGLDVEEGGGAVGLVDWNLRLEGMRGLGRGSKLLGGWTDDGLLNGFRRCWNSGITFLSCICCCCGAAMGSSALLNAMQLTSKLREA